MKPVRPGVFVVATLSLLVLDRCSLTGLDDFQLPRCTDDLACQPLNQSPATRADACHQYRCEVASGRCVLRVLDGDGDGDPPPRCGGADCADDNSRVRGSPVLAEVCDGADNNCNGVIDEGALVAGTAVELGRLPTGGADVTAFVGRNGAAVATALTVVPRDFSMPAQLWRIDGNQATVTPFAYQTTQGANDGALVAGCRQVRAGVEVLEPCSLGAVALDLVSMDHWVALAINRSGCASGQVRPALLASSGDANLVARGPSALSNIYRGVDVADDGCTGATRATGLRHGATRPVVRQVAGTPTAQAMAAWVGDGLDRAECGSDPAPVEAIGMWLEAGAYRGTSPSWLSGSGDGRPVTLGRSRNARAPAIEAWAGQGVFVAFADEGGHPGVTFVPAMGAPPGFNGVVAMARPEVARPTPSLTPGARYVASAVEGADGLAIALGPSDAAGAEIGMAWQIGCGEGSREIWFGRVRYTAGGAGTYAADAPIRVAMEVGAGVPQVVWSTQRFLREGAGSDADGGGVTDGRGWLVGWALPGGRGIGAARIARGGDRVIDAGPVTGTGELGRVGSVQIVATGGATGAAMRAVVTDGAAGVVRSVGLVCR